MNSVKAMALGAIAFALTSIGSVRADVDWKWDTSQHVDATPETASADISTLALPLTTMAEDEGFLSTFCYMWTESAPFRLTGGALGLILFVQ